jgi:translation initiation factor 2B subunit (eIF-2B alpha/beta/delta family)
MSKPAGLFELLNDNLSGSTELLLRLNELLSDNVHSRGKAEEIILTASSSFSSFAVIKNYLENVKRLLDKPEELQEYLHQLEEKLNRQFKILSEKLKEELGEITSLITISNSFTIYKVIKLLKDDFKNLKIIISESRPNMEGRILAEKLLKEEVKVELITEAMLPHYIPKADALISGADKILKNGNVVNKTGSRGAGIICSHFKKPFYILTSEEKFSDENSYQLELKDPGEVWEFKDDNLSVTNFYFEEVEKDLITKILTG